MSKYNREKRTHNPAVNREISSTETHEPLKPLPNWPKSHVNVVLTGTDQNECIEVVVHGIKHYLHSTTARALEEMLHESLEAYNESVTASNQKHNTAIPLV
jgi:hypothetical protein